MTESLESVWKNTFQERSLQLFIPQTNMSKRELYEQHSRDKGRQRGIIVMKRQGALSPGLFK
jgi:hypothetical protein